MKNKNIILSVHDISPKYAKELKIIFSKFDKMNINHIDFLVVLNWQNSYDIISDRKFKSLIKSRLKKGGSLVFHGICHYNDKKTFFHRIMYGKEHEFPGEFEVQNSLEYLLDCRKKFYKCFGIMPKNLVPARWNGSKKLETNAKKAGFIFYEDKLHILNLKKNISRISIPICFDFGENLLFNSAAVFMAKIYIFISESFDLPVRFSIHPSDIKNRNFEREIRLIKHLRNKGWNLMSTEKFWENETQ